MVLVWGSRERRGIRLLKGLVMDHDQFRNLGLLVMSMLLLSRYSFANTPSLFFVTVCDTVSRITHFTHRLLPHMEYSCYYYDYTYEREYRVPT